MGGCGGGRIRFDHERSWDDNTNLDKARRILWPVKRKYGLGLSWGDLIILTGNTAIEMMGGPVLGTCLGRVDETDGFWSHELGPSEAQQEIAPCPGPGQETDGDCQEPFGATTLKLIYVNPGGPFGNSTNYAGSAVQSRSSFGRMAMNDSETVALIGGGHAFGKCHGMCPEGAGESPKENPMDPWNGPCGKDKPHTSGFEGPWTTTPTQWSNMYFVQLMQLAYSNSVVSPGGGIVHHLEFPTSMMAPGAQSSDPEPIMMLTSDIALMHDPEGSYQEIVKEFAEDPAALDHAFAHAWYKLTTRDMGPVSRCLGPLTAPEQPWQYPLAKPIVNGSSVESVKAAIAKKAVGGNVAAFIRLALNSAMTFRVTDFRGGLNGARIRFAPEKDWPTNAGLGGALDALAPIHASHKISWADLIALAGTVALEKAGGHPMPFCPGRADAPDGAGSEKLEPWVTGHWEDGLPSFLHAIKISGLSKREYVAIMGLNRLGDMHEHLVTYSGSANTVGIDFYDKLLNSEWVEHTHQGLVETHGAGATQYKSGSIYALKTDVMMTWDAELLAIVQEYAVDDAAFKSELASAWTKLMTADRFDGPDKNVCDDINKQLTYTADNCPAGLPISTGKMASGVDGGTIFGIVIGTFLASTLLVGGITFWYLKKGRIQVVKQMGADPTAMSA